MALSVEYDRTAIIESQGELERFAENAARRNVQFYVGRLANCVSQILNDDGSDAEKLLRLRLLVDSLGVVVESDPPATGVLCDRIA